MSRSSIFSFCILFFISCQNAPTSSKIKPSSIKDVTLSEALELMKIKGDYVLLDVRTPEEISLGKMTDNALEIDFRNENFRSEILKLDRDKPYFVYCKSGGRSSKASKTMAEEGFIEVYNVLGGYSGYEEYLNRKK